MRLFTVPMERTSHYACAVACFSPGFVCINNSTVWRIFCERLQEGFQNKGIYHFIVCINNIVLLQLIYLFLIQNCRISVTAYLGMVELLIEWIVK